MVLVAAAGASPAVRAEPAAPAAPTAPATTAAGGSGAADSVTIPFTRAVANVEFLRMPMLAAPPRPGLAPPRATGATGAVWYGLITRRLEADLPAAATDHFVPFVVEYVGGVATRAWCDVDLDGDLDGEAMTLSPHPAAAGARSFLAPLRWTAPVDGRGVEVQPVYRVVLEPIAAGNPGPPPLYHLQAVFAMTGTVHLAGRPHRAFLFDGDGDGLYRPMLGDGIYVDLNDDGKVTVDPMGDEYGPFGVPFALGAMRYVVGAIDPEGRSIALRALGPAVPRPAAPEVGAPAPDFSFTSTSGRLERLSDYRGRPVLVYFWASTCRTCAHQADRLARLYDRRPQGMQILAVSYDTDRVAMEKFRDVHRQTWPTSFSGHVAWEDPVGRVYRERGSGVLYRVTPDGILAQVTADLGAIEAALDPPRSESGPAAR